MSEFLGSEAPASAPPLSWVAPIGQGDEWNPEFIKVLRFVRDHLIEVHPTEATLFERYLALEPLLDEPAKSEVIRTAAKQQYQAFESEQDQPGKKVNGWQLTSAIFGNREQMQGKYRMRAEATHFGLYGKPITPPPCLMPMANHWTPQSTTTCCTLLRRSYRKSKASGH